MNERSDASAFLKLIQELLILIIGTLVLSSLVTPYLFVGLKEIYPSLPWPYSRVFDRVVMVVAVVVFLLRRNHYDVKRYRAQLKGYVSRPYTARLVGTFFLSFLLSLSALPFVVAGGTLEWSGHSFGEVGWRFVKTLPAAALISVIEEIFFRFFLFLSLRRFLPFLAAATLSSMLYAVVHFIQPVKTWGFESAEWDTGFSYLGLLLDRFAQDGFLPAAFGLFLVGLVLCLTVERTKSILPALGLHAGWVTTTKVIGRLVGAAPGFEYPPGCGRRYYLLTHEVSWLAICIVGLVCFMVFREPKTVASNEHSEGVEQ